jgi:SpoVK/Ycf46/Vps4 family AAA+-type ATPase
MLSQVKIGYPALWMKTTEYSRLINNLVSFDFRNYFTINSEQGFCQYVDSMWKPVAVEFRDEENNVCYVKTYDFSLAVSHIKKNVYDKPVTFIVPVYGKPDATLFKYISFVYPLVEKYRTSFWSDTCFDDIQFIFISSFNVPEDYPNVFKLIEYDVPSSEDLYHIVDHINVSSHGRFVDSESVKDIVRSGIGLTENDFIDYCLQSIVTTGSLDSQYIYDRKMSSVKQKGILEIIKPKISFDNIGGLDNIKSIIKRVAFLRANKEQVSSFGITPIRRVLMVGIPGTGKSAICQAAASELGLDLARTGISQVMNSFVGQSEANMRAVFAQIRIMTPLCVWIDEFGRDLSGGASSSQVDAGTTDRVHAEFLTGLQELPDDTFLMCAANQLDNLRPEMLRADRFDKIVFVGLPSYSERIDILKIYLSSVQTDHQYNYDAIASATENFTGAEISSLIKEVKFFVATDELRPITTQDILAYVPNVKNIIWNKHRDMVKSMYSYALTQFDWASSEQQNDAQNIISGRTSSQPQVAWKI